MTRTKNKATPQQSDANDELNEQFHTLLREAAEKREEQAIAQLTANAIAAKQAEVAVKMRERRNVRYAGTSPAVLAAS